MKAKELIRRLSAIFYVVAMTASLAIPTRADDGGDVVRGLFGLVLGSIATSRAKESWNAVDPDIRACMTKEGADPNRLAERGIMAQDNRVASYLSRCRSMVEMQKAERKREEDARLAQLAAREKRLKTAAAAEEARRSSIASKYNPETAKKILEGSVTKGMTREQVLDARGRPDSKDVIPPSDELWQYGGEQIAFTDGKVTYIGH